MTISPALLAELRERHVAFVEARLQGAEAEALFRANVSAAIESILDAKLGDVAPRPRFVDALDRLVTHASFDAIARPIANALLQVVIAELHAERGKVGDRVPSNAREAFEKLVARPGLVPERLVREICEQDAALDVMRDVLEDALREFQGKVNPFSAEWGLPALVKKLSPFGFGVGKPFEAFKAEFERRLEPERKKFLDAFSRSALRRTADRTIATWDDPPFIALRTEVLRWALAQPIGDAARAAPADAIAEAHAAVLDIVRAALAAPELRARQRALVEGFFAANEERTVREVLLRIGVDPHIDADALADLAWPAVRAALATPLARAWFTALVTDFYDVELARADASMRSAG